MNGTRRGAALPLALAAALVLILGVPGPPAMAARCAPVEGIDALLRPGGVVLLGEIHGTEESPRFVSTVVCHALESGLGVIVGLELPQEEQAWLDGYLASRGKKKDRAAFVASPFWAKGYQDGRSSGAMLALIDDLRRRRRAGEAVQVALMDDVSNGFADRDRAMADALALARIDRPRDLLVALTGNMHNRTIVGNAWNPSYQPMGYLLGLHLPDAEIVALDVSHSGGAAWICTGADGCQVTRLRGHGSGDRLAVTLADEPDVHGFGGRYFVGSLHASPPAARP